MRFKKVYIEITNVCNLHCPFCVQNSRALKFMSLEEFSFILHEIQPFTKYIYLHVLGEALMHPKLADFLKLADEMNFYVNLTTNGTLLKERELVLSSSNALRQMNVSLHSFPDQKNYLQDVVEVCDHLYENCYISYRLWTIQKELNKPMKDTIMFLENHYSIQISSYENSIKLAPHRFLSFDQEFIWPDLTHSFNSDRGFCHGFKNMCAILSDGSVVPCCLDSKAQAKLGNIFEESFSSILNRNNYLLNELRDHHFSLELCQKCTYHSRFDVK